MEVIASGNSNPYDNSEQLQEVPLAPGSSPGVETALSPPSCLSRTTIAIGRLERRIKRLRCPSVPDHRQLELPQVCLAFLGIGYQAIHSSTDGGHSHSAAEPL